MTLAADLHLVEGDDPLPAPPAPQVFVRTLSAPPGAPWDQARVAALEARVGAPLPLGEVVYRVQRLDPWGLGRPARFAAAYVRAEEVGEDFETTVDAGGRSVRIRFLSMEARARQARKIGMIGAVAAVTALLTIAAITSSLGVRGETAARLSEAETMAASRLRSAQRVAADHAEARQLDAAGVRHLSVKDLLADMAWAGAAKAPGAHIDGLHWERGYMAVEVRGDAAPFANPDRAVLKADKPSRPGVWLWGVEPASSAKPAEAAPPPAPTINDGRR